MLTNLTEALAGLGAIALGLGGLLYAGRDRTADQHDVSDFRPPARRDWSSADVDSRQVGRRLRPAALLALTDPMDSAVTPPLARRLLIDHAVPTLSDAAVRGIADEWLREIAAEQRTLAGAR
ncbi:hypothetical protein [Micromonospora sediminicola]|uniref:hypothetical protein n=1 Tax=Micromonospora sediminicola TaxID=946078 RepID=UPI003791275D